MHLPTVGSFPADPFLHRFPNGTLMALGYACDIWGFQSSDNGRTWYLVPWGLGCSAVTSRDGSVLAMDYLTYPADNALTGPYYGRGRWVVPDYDNPGNPIQATLDIPGALPMIDDTGRYGGGPSFWRSIVELDDGTLLASGYGNFEHNAATPLGYPAEWGMRRFESFVIESHDRGHTWHLRSICAGDATTGQEGFCEPVMVDLGGGELLVVMRTGRASPLYQTRSLDYGYTWSQPVSLHVPGVDPSLIQLSDGTVVLGWGTRIPDAPWDQTNIDDYNTRYVEGEGDPPLERGGYIALSRDGGRSYSAPIKLDAGIGQSYTALIETTPGEVLFAIRHNWRKHTPGEWLTGEGRSYLYPITLTPLGSQHTEVGH
jgi:hypothetical protein